MTSAGFIETRGVAVEFRTGDERTLALDGLDVSIDRGEFVAVVGPSGCGKSTLMRLLTGLLKPTRGSVVVDETSVVGPVPGVGMAFQAANLLPWRTTRDNVMLPLEIVAPHKRLLRAKRSAYLERTEALLRTVGLDAFGDRYPWQLSGGMQQRANVLRAIVHDPSLLMLDEPFGSLDAFTREELWDVMQDLWMDKRFTAVLITHDLREATYLADRVLVMGRRPGRIVHETRIDLPRPRTLETTYDPCFVGYMHELRDNIQTRTPR